MELPLVQPSGSVSTTSTATSEVASRSAPAAPRAHFEVTEVAPAGPSPVAQARQPTQKELQQVVEQMQRKAQSFAPNLKFSVDHDTGRTIVKVTDANTQEVIRQIPAEEVLQLAKELDRMQGLLFHKEA